MVFYLYIAGVQIPLGILIHYPILLKYGFILFLVRNKVFIISNPIQEADIIIVKTIILAVLTLIVFSIIIIISWFSKIYKIKKYKVLVGMIIGGILDSSFNYLILNRLFDFDFVNL